MLLLLAALVRLAEFAALVLLVALAALVLLGAGRRGGARPPSPICMLVLLGPELAALVLLAQPAAGVEAHAIEARHRAIDHDASTSAPDGGRLTIRRRPPPHP